MIWWPTTTATGVDPADVEPETQRGASESGSDEWKGLSVYTDGTVSGTRVVWHGADITERVTVVFQSQRRTDPTIQIPVDTPCVECHGYGWGKTESGKDVPCRTCYGRGHCGERT